MDITRSKAVDDNVFQAELATIVENSFNIHQDGPRLVFREEENPQAKLMASARNDKLFGDGPDRLNDRQQLAREVRYVIGGTESVAKAFRVIVLGANWMTDPWAGVEEADLPAQWDDRIPLLVVPEPPDKVERTTRQLAQGTAADAPQRGALPAAARRQREPVLRPRPPRACARGAARREVEDAEP